MPTTAACPGFAYTAKADATGVARLRAAGAIPIGKTNLDQFATGLVGVRSPYGVPRNAFDPKLIPGGSSSGSAVAVAAGLVPFSLGTDTAGSGRVPAGLGNIVGLKPSLGAGLDRRRRARLPHARLRLGVRAHRRRRLGGVRRDGRLRTSPIPTRAIARSARPARCRRLRIGVPIKGERVFFGDQAVGRRIRSRDRALRSARRARSSRSTSSRSTRPRGCSTKARGSPSAISRRRS